LYEATCSSERVDLLWRASNTGIATVPATAARSTKAIPDARAIILERVQEMYRKEVKQVEPWEAACKIGSLYTDFFYEI